MQINEFLESKDIFQQRVSRLATISGGTTHPRVCGSR